MSENKLTERRVREVLIERAKLRRGNRRRDYSRDSRDDSHHGDHGDYRDYDCDSDHSDDCDYDYGGSGADYRGNYDSDYECMSQEDPGPNIVAWNSSTYVESNYITFNVYRIEKHSHVITITNGAKDGLDFGMTQKQWVTLCQLYGIVPDPMERRRFMVLHYKDQPYRHRVYRLFWALSQITSADEFDDFIGDATQYSQVFIATTKSFMKRYTFVDGDVIPRSVQRLLWVPSKCWGGRRSLNLLVVMNYLGYWELNIGPMLYGMTLNLSVAQLFAMIRKIANVTPMFNTSDEVCVTIPPQKFKQLRGIVGDIANAIRLADRVYNCPHRSVVMAELHMKIAEEGSAKWAIHDSEFHALLHHFSGEYI